MNRNLANIRIPPQSLHNPSNPLIIQSDKTILLEVNHALYDEVRDDLACFAELEKSPEYFHTYKISPLSLWNAAASGMTCDRIINTLVNYGKYGIPQNVYQDIIDHIERYGKVRMYMAGESLNLVCDDIYIMEQIVHHKQMQPYIINRVDASTLEVDSSMRGHIKHTLIKIGYPVQDLAGYKEGAPFGIELNLYTKSECKTFQIRDYQKRAVDIFHANGSVSGGSGVIVLPCGAGKTITAMAAMSMLKTQTLILTTNITALRQWKSELLDKTSINADDIGEYSGELKEIKPITIATYQILTHRKDKISEFEHMKIFNKNDWGFIIYDEVHLLPAPVFRMTAELQAKRRLGLTATLVREDGMEEDVFSLIGPKKYDVPWKELEKQGWIANAACTEIRVQMPDSIRMSYATSDIRNKFRIASENPRKLLVIDALLKKHHNDNILIIGQYLEQLQTIAQSLNAPLITGKTKNLERIKLYDAFKNGEIKLLVVSKVANFAIDLPDANVAIQISGTFGSRQEEAQRLGRILRPKTGENLAYFYSLVSENSSEQEFAINRQLFLTEQGYKYTIMHAGKPFALDNL